MKHMLAGKCEDVEALEYPLYASPKLDGIRATVLNGVVVSRNMKPFPCPTVQRLFGNKRYNNLDGELIVGNPNDPGAFRRTGSVVMSHAECTGELLDALGFHVFDDCTMPTTPFHQRFERARQRVQLAASRYMFTVPHVHVGSASLLLELEEQWLEQGFEGVMVRSPHGPYKFGRSTAREGWLLKLKRFEDSEAVIDAVEELFHNHNAAIKDANGRTKRSSHKAGKVAGGVLGNLLVRDVYTGVSFSIGSGFDAEARRALWTVRDELVGKVVRYRYFPTGSKERPRFPVFAGFRHPDDIDCTRALAQLQR